MAGGNRGLCGILLRKPVYSAEQLEGSLRRCLSVWDLIALGLGSCLGVGVYACLGVVALQVAGPSVVLSFFIAAIAALFAGVCYAEFASRVPKAGSAYNYAYVAVGEIVAFIIGWNMILEGIFGTASIARGISMYVDSMTNNSMSAWFESVAPLSPTIFSPYFDFFSFLIILVFGGLLALGVRESTYVNNILTVLHLAVILFIIIAGALTANSSNWSIPVAEVPESTGAGGFFPYGVWGTLRGAAVCFYGFVGFDAISATAEEVRDPRKVIPIAILCTLLVMFMVYACVATVVTMMVPYYMQDTITTVATAFSHVGMEWARWIVLVGGIFGLFASLYGCMFPLPRLVYAMSSDGLLCPALARTTRARHSPLLATLLPTALIAVLAALLELGDLVVMMCVGTLLAYTVIAASVILLRYRSRYEVAGSGYVKQIFGFGEKLPSKTTTNIINLSLLLFVCSCLAMTIIQHYVDNSLVSTAVFHVVAIVIIVIMALQPQVQEDVSFKTPLVPVVPCLSIYFNIQLMVLLSLQTWIRVLIWIAIGIPVYVLCACCYRKTDKGNLENNLKNSMETTVNGKPPVQIYIESPTPPGTTRSSNIGGDEIVQYNEPIEGVTIQENTLKILPVMTEEVKVLHAFVEDTEKEAKIIDLLDQVLQAEEDSYGEIISLKEQNGDKEETENGQEPVLDRHSLTELSDAGSDASMGNQVLSKYDVIAQVHREDLPKVTEEDERNDKEEEIENEEVTAFNDDDSRTDESGYSDTIDRACFNESINDSKEDISNIPVPPPLDDNYFTSPNFKKSYTISGRSSKSKLMEPNEESSIQKGLIESVNSTNQDNSLIPAPPPFDENYFANPTFKKAYTISARPSKSNLIESDEITEPRESIQSNNSYDDTPMVFGSDKQMNFMSKLNNIFQNKISSTNEVDEQRKRSNSTGDVVEKSEITWNRERPSFFLDLQKQIVAGEVAQNLRQVDVEENKPDEKEEEIEDSNLSREDLKSKLETIFAAGGPQVFKPRLMKSNPPTPEEAYQTDTSSAESLAKLPKMEKNDTLKRQKTKFGEVLNSFRLTLTKDDDVL